MYTRKILVVDDDVNIAELIALYMAKEGYEVIIAENGEDALKMHAEQNPDLIILDIMLPGMNGYDVCDEIRKTSMTPILMLSAKAETFDKVTGLDCGADDYLIKPFDPIELIARVKAILRRFAHISNEADNNSNELVNDKNALVYADLVISLSNYSVLYKGQMLDMPPKEIELLHFLASHPNHVYSREQLLDNIWGYEHIVDTRTVDVHIKRIRAKINDHDLWKISTVWGIGYKFELIK